MSEPFDAAYLDSKIAEAAGTWEGVDGQAFLDELRGREDEESELPEGWVETTLGEVVHLEYGKSLPEKLRDGMNYPVYGSNGVVGYHSTPLVKTSCIIVGRKGSAGVVNLSEGPCSPIDTTYYIASPTLTDLQFTYHLIKTLGLDQMDRATAIPGLNREDAYQKVIPLPPLPEQKRIVAKLDTLLGRLGECQARLERVPALLKRFRQSVLAAATSGRLTEDWRDRTDDPSDARDLLERMKLEKAAKLGRKYRSSKDTSSSSDLQVDLYEIPDSWIWTTFDECAWEITVGHVGPMSTRYVPSGIPFLRSQNVRPMQFEIKGMVHIGEDFHAELPKSSLKGGEILVVRSGANTGDCCLFPNNAGRANCADLVITRPLSGLLGEYGVTFIVSPFGQSQLIAKQTGVAQPHFNVGAMKTKPFPLPPLPEQLEIVRRVESLFALADRIEARYRPAKTKVDRLQPAMLAKAFRGELVPQDPNDEPANVLLERLNAQPGTQSARPRQGKGSK